MESENKDFNLRLELRVKNSELVRAREYLGLNQKEAAESIGIGSTYLNGIECLRVYPSKDCQGRICSTYRDLGFFILEEDVFPEELRRVKIGGKVIVEGSIPQERLISLSSLPERFLPYIEPDVTNEIYNEEMETAVKGVLSELDERRRTAVKMYFGIDCDRRYTLGDIANHMGLNTHERVKQMINEAFRKIRRHPKAERLIPFVVDLK